MVEAAWWSDADGSAGGVGPPDEAPSAYLAGNALRTASASAVNASTSAPYFALAWAKTGCTTVRQGPMSGRETLAPLLAISFSWLSSLARTVLRLQSAASFAALVTASRSAGESFCPVRSEIVSGIGL